MAIYFTRFGTYIFQKTYYEKQVAQLTSRIDHLSRDLLLLVDKRIILTELEEQISRSSTSKSVKSEPLERKRRQYADLQKEIRKLEFQKKNVLPSLLREKDFFKSKIIFLDGAYANPSFSACQTEILMRTSFKL
jgi:hypothetical protein